MIKALNLYVAKNSKVILKDFSISFEPYHLHLIQGENGCGKSTLLRCLVNYHDVDSGTIQCDVKWIYQPQLPHLFGPLVKHNFQKKDIDNPLIKAFQIDHLMTFPVSRMSGGERQKIAFVRTLLMKSDYYILDEPDAFLDHDSKLLLYQTIIEHMRTHMSTFIVVSHSQDFPKQNAIVHYIVSQNIQVKEEH